jgi:hypothetical protein
LSTLISQFKATTTRKINEMRGLSGQIIWQRGYHDRIIRNEVELDKVRAYIRNNPKTGIGGTRGTPICPRNPRRPEPAWPKAGF